MNKKQFRIIIRNVLGKMLNIKLKKCQRVGIRREGDGVDQKPVFLYNWRKKFEKLPFS